MSKKRKKDFLDRASVFAFSVEFPFSFSFVVLQPDDVVRKYASVSVYSFYRFMDYLNEYDIPYTVSKNKGRDLFEGVFVEKKFQN